MENIKLNVKALAKMQNLSLRELATKADISFNHLWGVAYRGVKLTADDIRKLSKVTNVPMENIG